MISYNLCGYVVVVVLIFSITFLYKLTPGAAKKSYGLNVARLAKVRLLLFFS